MAILGLGIAHIGFSLKPMLILLPQYPFRNIRTARGPGLCLPASSGMGPSGRRLIEPLAGRGALSHSGRTSGIWALSRGSTSSKASSQP